MGGFAIACPKSSVFWTIPKPVFILSMHYCFSLSAFCVALTQRTLLNEWRAHILFEIVYVFPTLHHLDGWWAPFRGITLHVPGASMNHCENVKLPKLQPGTLSLPLLEDSRTLTHLMSLKIPPTLSLLGFVHFNPADTYLTYGWWSALSAVAVLANSNCN